MSDNQDAVGWILISLGACIAQYGMFSAMTHETNPGFAPWHHPHAFAFAAGAFVFSVGVGIYTRWKFVP